MKRTYNQKLYSDDFNSDSKSVLKSMTTFVAKVVVLNENSLKFKNSVICIALHPNHKPDPMRISAGSTFQHSQAQESTQAFAAILEQINDEAEDILHTIYDDGSKSNIRPTDNCMSWSMM